MKNWNLRSLLASGLTAALLFIGASVARADVPGAVPVPASASTTTADAPAARVFRDVAPATVERTSPGHYRLRWSGLDGSVSISVASVPDAPAAERQTLARGLVGEEAGFEVDQGGRPYFHIEDRNGHGLWVAERLLPLEGGRNFRDLGGYLTADGHQVRWGKLFRSGAMAELGAADQKYLSDLGLRQVCDFRTTSERVHEPARWLEAGGAVDYWTRDYEMSDADFSRLLTDDITEAGVKASFARLYGNLAYEQSVAFREMFRMLVEGDLPLAFNCTAGKDRTGVAAALILTALGVPRETVLADYELTNRYLTPTAFLNGKDRKTPEGSKAEETKAPLQQMLARLPPPVIKAMLGAEPEYLAAVFGEIEQRSGSVNNYFHEVLGVSDADLARLRAELLD
ncbi:MAG TPA: tyrosine-protein phosphatase [Pseudomonadales bacterium]|nr:tyrosine-protein phosphatase [Pseudomonadales bacterium]